MTLRTKLAVGITALYLSAFFVILFLRWSELVCLPLNEVGDFLAGAFGPLALAWLVFGYFQQGEELRQGTIALRMQAEELRASVKQQAEMVEATRQTLKHYDVSLEPLLKMEFRGISNIYTRAGMVNRLSLLVTNSGGYCENLVIRIVLDGREVDIDFLDDLAGGQSGNVKFDREIIPMIYYGLTVSYLKSNGSPGVQSFEIMRSEQPGVEAISIIKQYGS
ncbi:hypothetical protein PSCICN_38320 [Pseudomonas cichorii]|uniref:hypothetical protein n=1 Tax=Pseudomonas cichorii TaxID=36746 RepID=UPI001910F5BD|nr:hypothetical protein [Pseudomonas cichorii]GFM83140.1 hypothetical protein PSCICN_38320 [Pseudomonas cichorii]